MYSIGFAIRIYFVFFVLTYSCLKLFTYLFHGKAYDYNILELTIDIVGLMASTFVFHITFLLLKKKNKKNFKNYFIFYSSIFGIIMYLYYIVIKVI